MMSTTPSAMDDGKRSLLITGGCGFIGSHFVRLVLQEMPGWKVINVDLLTYAGNEQSAAGVAGAGDATRYRFIKADIADTEAMRVVFQSEKIDAVVNLAAESHVDRSLLNSAPFLKTNVEGTRVLLDMAARRGVDRFLQVSTDEVYGSLDPDSLPFTEESPLRPNSPYAASKAAADLLVRAYHHSYGLPTLITRCGNNYGPYQFPEKFLPLFITNALDDQPLPLYGDGQNVRDWIHVEDHAQALLRVLVTGIPGEIYNISAGEEQSNLHMTERLLHLLGKPKNLIRYVKDRPGHDRRYALDGTKLQSKLGWQPRISLQGGLQGTITWYQEHRAWWEQIKSGEYRTFYTQWYVERLEEALER